MIHTSVEAPGLPAAMTILQDRLYNSLLVALAASPTSFQLSVPATPLPASDAGLWASMNLLPPRSLTFDRSQPAGQYFTAYAAVVEQLQYAPTLASVIGAAVFSAWTTYLASLKPPPSICGQGPIFRSWAEDNGYFGVAGPGASNLVGACLFERQQQAVVPYQGPDGLPVDFVGGYDSLLAALASAGSVKLAFDSSTTNPGVSGTWAGGQQLGLQGLWAGSNPLEAVSVRFAAHRVRLSATITHCTPWVATPGAWYSSSLLNAAYSSQATPPWPVGADPSWSDAFGPTGSLLRFLASLTVGDGLALVVTSGAKLSATDQATITAHADQGLWPFYMPTGGAVTNAVSFDPAGHMTITTKSAVGSPFVLGGTVLGIAQYLESAA